MVHTLHVIKRLQLKDGITGLIFVIDKDMAQVFVIPDESDDSDEDDRLEMNDELRHVKACLNQFRVTRIDYGIHYWSAEYTSRL